MIIRKATIDDIDAIDDLEQRSFSSDQISRSGLIRLLKKGNCLVLLEESDQGVHGYVLLLFRRGVSLARLYSIAVSSDFRKMGVGDRLVQRAEEESLKKGIYAIRLEVRKDNDASLGLFKKHGYSEFAEYEDYYEDHMDAIRLQKVIDNAVNPKQFKVPFYCQTLDFTCGPASLMMAFKALNHKIKLNRGLELKLWRQATTIFMTSGHGGSHPYGMALAAYHQGFRPEVFINPMHSFLVDSVRSEDKKDVMIQVENQFLEDIKTVKIPIRQSALMISDLEKKFNQGAIPIVLISSYKMYKEKSPHWVVITGFSQNYVFINDSYVDFEKHKSEMDSMNIPIAKINFNKMIRYGRNKTRAVLLIWPNQSKDS